MRINDFTFLVNIFYLPVWAVWECTALWLRSKGIIGGHVAGTESLSVETISMVMKNRAYQMNALPLFWSGMLAHWWWNWFSGKTWNVPYPAIAFWLLIFGTLVLDTVLWNTPYNTLHPVLKFYRAPMVQTFVGLAAGLVLFPQAMVRLAGWRWW